MDTQTAMHRLPIGSLAASQFSSSPLQLQMCTMTLGYTGQLPQWLTDAEPSLPLKGMLADRFPLFSLALFLWTGFSFFDSLDGVCRDRLTLLESEYCPTSFPTVHPKVPYK